MFSFLRTYLISKPFNFIIFTPFYNALVFLTAVLPGHSFGAAVIVLTVAVRSLLMPFSHKAVVAQRKMRIVQPKLDEIRKKTTDREEQAKQMLELYKEHGINPFSGFGPLLIQIPVILGLYYVIRAGVSIDSNVLYGFVSAPETINVVFLGLVDLTQKSAALALVAGLTQFVQTHLAMPKVLSPEGDKELSPSEEFSRILQTQMRYIPPILIGVVALSLPSALALYWSTSNVFSIFHELTVKRRFQATLDSEE